MNFITGGAGFIGSHLYKRIGGAVYDNLSAPNAEMPNGRGFGFDVKSLDNLVRSMNGVDTVWHLAASSDIAVGNKFTDTDLKNNTIGTYNVLESMRLNGISKLVFSSSATYYGKQPGPWVETMPPAPTSLYGASKVAGEALISAYASLFGIKAWVFRFGNVVGGRMGHGVLFDFINKLKAIPKDQPKELTIIGDGNQERPFFLVEDCIDGMIAALQYPPDTYNLGPTDYTTINELAQIVIEEMGLKNVKITHSPATVWDVPIVTLNTAKIQELGWKPSHTSDEAARIAVQRLL
jgi:UDP-glucose 4-epimerase